ncbi:glycosyl hydrolase 53-domain-containing protein [Favolaschia claudopus]|uniref:Glycosyl hydrolase 53-domain-containing protein n=1 Tax=Favolaschia claudopus TaxID=2862362 RepID=A0AAW0D6W0_9AGAR
MFFYPFSASALLVFALSVAAASSKGSMSSSAPNPSSSTASASAANPPKKSNKRGLAFAAENPTDVLKGNSSASVATWVYNWALVPPDYIAESGIEYIPMQWGAADIEKLAVTVKGLGAKTILAFNEPDFDQQSNINATFAAQLWMQYIQPLKQDGIRLGGPAISSGPSGLPWLQDFMAACSQCTIDFLPFHWYGSGSGGFFDYLYSLNGEFPHIPLWITEFAETSSNDSVVLDFMNQTITTLDGLDFVERYAWFGFFRPKDGSHYNLLDVNGNLNAAGQVYVDAAKKVVNALPNPTGSGPDGATNSAGGLTTVFPASDTGLTPGFATQTGNSGLRVGGNEIVKICGVGGAMFAAAVFGAALVW